MKISLRAARVNSGLSLKEVARTIGKNANTVRKWEVGEASVSAIDFLRLCELYNMKVDDIFLPNSPHKVHYEEKR